MQFLLSKLYEHRSGPRLTMAAYDALKGVAGVVEERAEAAIREPNGSIDRAAIVAMFRALVTVDPQTGSPVRRRAALAALTAIRPLVDRMVDSIYWSRGRVTAPMALCRWHTRRCCCTGSGSSAGCRSTAG